ncbi:hypothetical protein CIPAW_04G113000 [Carya illinoinensis]|uniref:Cytochrome P450 n=1 Tax=Carya illinoinensis TaxID=32201 RepID=A0A8T1QS79_CARIL|nr:hypothetical protein CIPAW_04G113000 [Carya illinoinensis]
MTTTNFSIHAYMQLKSFAMDILKQGSKTWVTEVLGNLETMWDGIESTISKSGSASYIIPLQQFIFKFLMKSLVGADPSVSQEIADSGYIMLDRWLAVQLLPTVKIGILQPLEEIFLHSWAYPFLLVSGDYKKLCDFVKKEGKEVLRRGETEFGLSAEDSLHNLLFILGFNAFGGFSVYLPGLMSRIVSDKTGLQEKIGTEVKEKAGSTLSFDSVKEMPLVMSLVYETLRLSPPVPTQYGRARKDFILSSHDSVYNIKKGELLCGYQPLVMRDPKIFDDPESFKPDRFMNEKGSELLNYLYWSNGPQTGSPSTSNKQCAAKDYVVLTTALFVAYIFSRYDSIVGDSSSITAVEKAQ